MEAQSNDLGFGFTFRLNDEFVTRSKMIRQEFRRFKTDSADFRKAINLNFTNPLTKATAAAVAFVAIASALNVALRGMAGAVPNLAGLTGATRAATQSQAQAAANAARASVAPTPATLASMFRRYGGGNPMAPVMPLSMRNSPTANWVRNFLGSNPMAPRYPGMGAANMFGNAAARMPSYNAGGYMGPQMGSAGMGAYPQMGGMPSGAFGAGMAPYGRLARMKMHGMGSAASNAYTDSGMRGLVAGGNPIAKAVNENIFGLFAGLGLAKAGTGMMGGFGKASKDSGDVEAQILGLTTILHSRSKANYAFEGIKKDALSTPFDIENLTQANRFLLEANNGNIEKTRADVMGLGNAISAVGRGNDEFIRMAYNMQQVHNQGKANALDIRQFAMAGINIYGLLSDAFGKSVEELKDYEITFPMITKAFEFAMAEGGRYYKGFENQMSTAQGKAQRFHETIQLISIGAGDLYNTFLKPAYDMSNMLFMRLLKIMDGPAGKAIMGSVMGLVAGGGLTLVLAGLVTIIGAIAPALAAILPIAIPLTMAFLTLGKSLSMASVGMGNADKWLLDGKKGGLENTKTNRFGAYFRAASDIFNSYNGGSFKIKGDTMDVFKSLGMGESDILGVANAMLKVKANIKGFFDTMKWGFGLIGNTFEGEGVGAKFFRSIFGGESSNTGQNLARLTLSIIGLGLAFAVLSSPMLKVAAGFAMFEWGLNKLGVAEPMLDALGLALMTLSVRMTLFSSSAAVTSLGTMATAILLLVFALHKLKLMTSNDYANNPSKWNGFKMLLAGGASAMDDDSNAKELNAADAKRRGVPVYTPGPLKGAELSSDNRLNMLNQTQIVDYLAAHKTEITLNLEGKKIHAALVHLFKQDEAKTAE